MQLGASARAFYSSESVPVLHKLEPLPVPCKHSSVPSHSPVHNLFAHLVCIAMAHSLVVVV